MKIVPGKSVGELAVGMRRNEYEALIGVSEDKFKRTPDDRDWVIAYDDKCMHLTVDGKRTIKSITVFRPEKVELENIQLLGRDLTDVESDLRQSAFTVSKVDAGLWIPKAGVLIIETDGKVDGVEVMAAK